MRSSVAPRRLRTRWAGLAVAAVTLAPVALVAHTASAAPDEPEPLADVKEVPTWYDQNRVQSHTQLNLGFGERPSGQWIDTPEWEQSAPAFKAMGANTLNRHLIAAWEDPWWPSDAPRGPEGERLFDDDRINANTIFLEAGRDVVTEMVQQAQAEDMEQVLYFRLETDRTSEELHPEWVCKDPDGVPLTNNRGTWLDLTGPYGDVVLTRLLELAERGVDAVNFDAAPLPPNGCWGSTFQENYEQTTGQPAPTVIDRAAPEFQDWLDFHAEELVRIVQHWHDVVKAQYPDFTFIVGANWSQALSDRGEHTDLMRVADAVKSEYRHSLHPRFNFRFFRNNPDFAVPESDIRQALGFTVLRDSAQGRPPSVWAPAIARNTDHLLAFISSVVTYGGIARNHVREENIFEANNPEGFTPREANIAGFELGNKVSPHLAGTIPGRWAAVHYSEGQRNARFTDARDARQDVLWPVTGAFGVLSREGVPVGTVTDTQLELGELDGYQLLFLTSRDELTTDQKAVVADFEASGGVVIENDPAWAWHDPDGTEAAAAAFLATVAPHLPEAPVHVTGGPEKLHAVGYGPRDTGELSAVAIANDFSFVQMYAAASDEETNPAPPPAEGVQVAWHSDNEGLTEVYEAVSEQWLPTTPTDDGYVVTLPEFQHMALLVLDPDVSFEDAVTLVNEYHDAGVLDRSQWARMLVHLSVAERLADRGLVTQAQRALDRFVDVASDVADADARADLIGMAERLAGQLTDE